MICNRPNYKFQPTNCTACRSRVAATEAVFGRCHASALLIRSPLYTYISNRYTCRNKSRARSFSTIRLLYHAHVNNDISCLISINPRAFWERYFLMWIVRVVPKRRNIIHFRWNTLVKAISGDILLHIVKTYNQCCATKLITLITY